MFWHKTFIQPTVSRNFSQTDFSNRVTTLSLKTALKECGLVLLVICLAHFDESWTLLDDTLLSKGHNTNLKQVLEAPVLGWINFGRYQSKIILLRKERPLLPKCLLWCTRITCHAVLVMDKISDISQHYTHGQ